MDRCHLDVTVNYLDGTVVQLNDMESCYVDGNVVIITAENMTAQSFVPLQHIKAVSWKVLNDCQ